MSGGSASEEQCVIIVLKHSYNKNIAKNNFKKQTVILLKTIL